MQNKILIHELLNISISNKEIEALEAASINEIISRSACQSIFIDFKQTETDAFIAGALRLLNSNSFSGLIVIGGGSLPLLFTRNCWQLLNGFSPQVGEKIFSDFLSRARKLREFNVLQLG